MWYYVVLQGFFNMQLYLDPEARASGSERETGRARASEILSRSEREK